MLDTALVERDKLGEEVERLKYQLDRARAAFDDAKDRAHANALIIKAINQLIQDEANRVPHD